MDMTQLLQALNQAQDTYLVLGLLVGCGVVMMLEILERKQRINRR